MIPLSPIARDPPLPVPPALPVSPYATVRLQAGWRKKAKIRPRIQSLHDQPNPHNLAQLEKMLGFFDPVLNTGPIGLEVRAASLTMHYPRIVY